MRWSPSDVARTRMPPVGGMYLAGGSPKSAKRCSPPVGRECGCGVVYTLLILSPDDWKIDGRSAPCPSCARGSETFGTMGSPSHFLVAYPSVTPVQRRAIIRRTSIRGLENMVMGSLFLILAPTLRSWIDKSSGTYLRNPTDKGGSQYLLLWA